MPNPRQLAFTAAEERVTKSNDTPVSKYSEYNDLNLCLALDVQRDPTNPKYAHLVTGWTNRVLSRLRKGRAA